MLALLAAGLLAAPPAADPPKTVLRNDALTLTVLLPDARHGAYRGSRFDWAGVVGPVEIGGRKVFVRDPADPDAPPGPAEEFGTDAPLGYADAKPGETFLKIGVGALVKPKEEKYQPAHPYQVKYPGEWQVSVGTREVEFRQELLARSGYGYRYVKRVLVHDTLPQFSLSHELTNSGTRPIDTDVATRTHFNVTNGQTDAPEPVGPAYKLSFRFAASAPDPQGRWADAVQLTGRELGFGKPVDGGPGWAELKGLGRTPADNWATLQHQPSNLSLTTEGTLPVERYRVWVGKGSVCPEPSVRVAVKPGERQAWSVTYTFQGNRYLR